MTKTFRGFSVLRVMKWRKKMKRIILIMIVLIIIMKITTVAGLSFTDVKNSDWYKADLEYIVNDSRGILSGYPDGTYRPDVDLQVDQFIKTVIMAAGYTIGNGEGYWAQSYIDKAIEEGFIGENDFDDYTDYITREEMAAIVVKVMQRLESTDYQKTEEISSNLRDVTSIMTRYKEDVCKVYELGIITGYPDGTFKPKNTLPRREATVVLRRIIDASARKPYESPEVVDYEAHFKGGELWVDPVTASDEENLAVDLLMIESEELYFHKGGSYEWEDQLTVKVFYKNKNDFPTNELESLERLIARRLSVENTSKIMDYIYLKVGWNLLPEKGKEFRYEGYRVEILDNIALEGSELAFSRDISLMMWYE